MRTADKLLLPLRRPDPHPTRRIVQRFLDASGSFERPAALVMAALDNRCGAGSDSCAVLQVRLTLPPMEQREVTFILGAEKSQKPWKL